MPIMKKWTKKEEDYLLEWYNVVPMSTVAKRVGRTANAVRCKVRLMRKKGFKFHTRGVDDEE